jgi:hypothetical protein
VFEQSLSSVCAWFAQCLCIFAYVCAVLVLVIAIRSSAQILSYVYASLCLFAHIVSKEKIVCAVFAQVCNGCAGLHTGQRADVMILMLLHVKKAKKDVLKLI